SFQRKMIPPQRMYIELPKKYRAVLSKFYDLDHGLFITDLNPYINEDYVAAYFKPFGCVTIPGSSKDRLAYVRFSTEAEADLADWAGPHFIGGTECKVRRVVSPKVRCNSFYICKQNMYFSSITLSANIQICLVGRRLVIRCAHSSANSTFTSPSNGSGLQTGRSSVVR
uniref:RRM domain-containing protein n=1 Tax=Xiphophorus maculatus TaxID=8083 RepID=A0A3B5QLX2_XIPMA